MSREFTHRLYSNSKKKSNISQVHYISNQRIPETGDTSGVMIEYQVGTFKWILTKGDFDQDGYLHLLVKESESEGAPSPAHFLTK